MRLAVHANGADAQSLSAAPFLGSHPLAKKSRTPKRKYGPNSDFRNKTKSHLAAQELFVNFKKAYRL
jgi:hypothetical protein